MPARSPSDGNSVSRSRFRVCYQSPVWHLLALGALTITIVLGSAVVHQVLERPYARSAGLLVENAVKNYHFRAEDSGLRFYVGETPYTSADRDTGAFGLARSPSVRGAIADCLASAQAYSNAAVQHAARIASQVRGGGDAGGGSLAFQSRRGATRVIVSRESWQRLEAGYPSAPEKEVRRFLRSGKVVEFGFVPALPFVDSSAGSPLDGRVRAAAKTALAAAGQTDALGMNWRALTDAEITEWIEDTFARPAPPRADAAETAAKPRDRTCGDCDRTDRCRCDRSERETDYASDCEQRTSPTEREACRLTASVRRALRQNVDGEHGSAFWLVGYWKWLEIVIWTWFGVLTRALYDYGAFCVSGKVEGKRFEPRESWRVLSRLVYGPLIALVFFWLATTTGLIDAPTFLVDYTLGALAFAFLVGLFPNTIYRLISSVIDRLLKGGEGSPGKTQESGGSVVVPSSPPTRAPKLADLAAKLGDIATAPLRPPT